MFHQLLQKLKQKARSSPAHQKKTTQQVSQWCEKLLSKVTDMATKFLNNQKITV